MDSCVAQAKCLLSLHQCPQCNYRSHSRGSVKRHVMYRHTGEKPHACSVCHRRFTAKENLQVHMRLHTGEKPFKCNLCSQRFTQKHHVRSHFLTRHHRKWFYWIEQEKKHLILDSNKCASTIFLHFYSFTFCIIQCKCKTIGKIFISSSPSLNNQYEAILWNDTVRQSLAFYISILYLKLSNLAYWDTRLNLLYIHFIHLDKNFYKV